MTSERVVLIGREGSSTAMLYHALAAQFDVSVALEAAPSTWLLWRSRIRRLGIWKVLGQLLFLVLVAKPLALLSDRRKRAIMAEQNANDAAIPAAATVRIGSVNGEECRAWVDAQRPAVIVINGTRIVRAQTLAAWKVPVLNTHVGITPRYRGVHGAYWALANNDRDHCGVTVHLVDTGVDTGGVLYQSLIPVTPADNFSTYPALQMAVGSTLLVRAVKDVLEDRVQLITPPEGDRRWYHPTLFEYLYNRTRKGVR